MTRRVLIAWEIGSGLGHLACMPPVIERLRIQGVDPVVAVPDPARLGELMGKDAPPSRTIVRPVGARAPESQDNSFADILLRSGFEDADALRSTVEAWQRLLREEKAEAVLLDYAPMAQLAAWLMDIPMVTRSTVFANPPVPLPFIRPWEQRVPTRALAVSEQRLVDNINAVAAHYGRKPIESLAEWLHAPARFTTGTAETNFFEFPPLGYLGNLAKLPAPEPPAWRDSGRRRVLCYLRWSRGVPSIVNALAAPDRELVCVVTGAPDIWARAKRRHPVQILTKPVALPTLLAAADVVVSHGSANIACEAIAAGKPQLLFPFDLEKGLIARKLGQLGVALALRPGRKVSEAQRALQRLFDEPEFTARSKAIGATYRPQEWESARDRMVKIALGFS